MRESDLSQVLLVKAIEEADRAGALLPLGDRERAAREALRSAGIGAAEVGQGGLTAVVEGALADRASRLAQPLLERHPVLKEIQRRARRPAGTGLVLVVAAFAAGLGMSALDGSRRINILAPPLLGLVLWNLLVYLVLAIGAGRRLRPGVRAAMPFARSVSRGIGRRLGPLLERTVQVDTVLGAAVRRFVADWSEAAAPLLGRHLRRWLHLGAALVAAGLVAGLYLRGIVLRYEAGWESTFLEPEQVMALVGLLFGQVASWAGIALPQTPEEIAQLRWEAGAGGGAAAPWIHLIALCLTALVVLPRLALAAGAWLSGWRLQQPGHLPAPLAAYARLVLGAGAQGEPVPVSVTPYAFDPPAGTAQHLAALLSRTFGGVAHPELRAVVAYGDEDAIAAAFDADAHRVAGRVLLMNLAATPETENHGAAIVAARDHVRRTRPAVPLLVVVDESSYAARFAAEAAAPGRLEERRRLWREFAAGYGVEVGFRRAGEEPPAAGA
jgi:hypothetical protein